MADPPTVEQFIRSNLLFDDPHARLPAAEAVAVFRDWRSRLAPKFQPALTERALKRQIAAQPGVTRERDEYSRYYRGVRFDPDITLPEEMKHKPRKGLSHNQREIAIRLDRVIVAVEAIHRLLQLEIDSRAMDRVVDRRRRSDSSSP